MTFLENLIDTLKTVRYEFHNKWTIESVEPAPYNKNTIIVHLHRGEGLTEERKNVFVKIPDEKFEKAIKSKDPFYYIINSYIIELIILMVKDNFSYLRNYANSDTYCMVRGSALVLMCDYFTNTRPRSEFLDFISKCL